jgi:hypothetical protein
VVPEALYSPGTARTARYVFFFMGEIGVTVSRTSVDRRSVVAADVTLASLSKKLAERRITPSAETVVFDSGGVLAWSGVAAGLVEEQGTLRRRNIAELGHPALAAAAQGKTPEGLARPPHGAGLQRCSVGADHRGSRG